MKMIDKLMVPFEELQRAAEILEHNKLVRISAALLDKHRTADTIPIEEVIRAQFGPFDPASVLAMCIAIERRKKVAH